MTARTKQDKEETIDDLVNNFMADFYSPESEAKYIKNYLLKAFQMGKASQKQEGKEVIGYNP